MIVLIARNALTLAPVLGHGFVWRGLKPCTATEVMANLQGSGDPLLLYAGDFGSGKALGLVWIVVNLSLGDHLSVTCKRCGRSKVHLALE